MTNPTKLSISKKITSDDQDYHQIKDYATLLLSKPWRNKRKEILKRDAYKCSYCTSNETLNIKGISYKALEQYGYNVWGKPLFQLVVGKNPISLHVHHKLYVLERLPWNYYEEELITLCHICHLKEHKQVSIPVYRTERHKMIGEASYLEVCVRCGGDGHLPEFNYHENGVCFGCDGLGFLKN